MSTTPRRHFESLSQAAERTGLSTRTLRRRISTGELAAYRNGRRVIRLDPDDVDRLLVRVPSASEAPERPHRVAPRGMGPSILDASTAVSRGQ